MLFILSAHFPYEINALSLFRIGIRHVSEIADLALDLVEKVQVFRIPHRPEKPLEIRAGLNSGPCVAGAVVRAKWNTFTD